MSENVVVSVLHIEDNILEAALIEELLIEALQKKKHSVSALKIKDTQLTLRHVTHMTLAEQCVLQYFYDIILLDLHLGKVLAEVSENIQRLQLLSPLSDIIVLSSDESALSEKKSLQAGASLYRIKGYVTAKMLLADIRFLQQNARYRYQKNVV